MELYDVLMEDDVVSSIRNNLDGLLEIIPEINSMIGFEHRNPHHHLDVWEHTLLALSLSDKDFDVRLCLLLHDIGKPFSYQGEEIRHYSNHPKVSKEMSEKILKRLNYDDEYIEKICYLVGHHDIPITKNDIQDNYELMSKLYKIQYCDALAHHPDKLQRRIDYLSKTEKKLLLVRNGMEE